jgi:hypothetical protein
VSNQPKGGVSAALDNKVTNRARLTRASIVWFVAALTLIPYEILCIVRRVDGGPLSHVMWWAYGDHGSLRWWLWTWGFIGWSAWCCWHFAYRWPNQWHLLALVTLGLAVGAVGYLITR